MRIEILRKISAKAEIVLSAGTATAVRQKSLDPMLFVLLKEVKSRRDLGAIS
jgi:hypothetical protein